MNYEHYKKTFDELKSKLPKCKNECGSCVICDIKESYDRLLQNIKEVFEEQRVKEHMHKCDPKRLK